MSWYNPVIGRRGPGTTDQVLFDAWSLVHFASGLLLWKIGLPANVAIMVIVVAELIENFGGGVAFFNWLGRNFGWIKIFDGQEDYRGDSVGNMLMDIVIGITAFTLAWYGIIPLGEQWF
tara:strand:- start:449 stop:805 length:357 start_codon:yes stop_codon:yes gene_type:complete